MCAEGALRRYHCGDQSWLTLERERPSSASSACSLLCRCVLWCCRCIVLCMYAWLAIDLYHSGPGDRNAHLGVDAAELLLERMQLALHVSRALLPRHLDHDSQRCPVTGKHTLEWMRPSSSSSACSLLCKWRCALSSWSHSSFTPRISLSSARTCATSLNSALHQRIQRNTSSTQVLAFSIPLMNARSWRARREPGTG